MERRDIENIAEEIVRRLDRRDCEEIRGLTMDAIHDACAKAIPEVLRSDTLRRLAEAIDNNTSRASFEAGWNACRRWLGLGSAEAVPSAFAKALSEYQSCRDKPYQAGAWQSPNCPSPAPESGEERAPTEPG